MTDTTDDVLVEQRARRAVAGQRRARAVGLGVVGVLLVLGVWQVAVALTGIDPLVLPSPVAVLGQLGVMAAHPDFWKNVGVSLVEFVGGYAIGLVAGVGTGLAVSELTRLRLTVHPVVEAFRFIVPFAWIPLVVLWFGTSIWGKIVLVAYAVYFVMVVSSAESLRRVDPILSRAATVLGMSRWRRAWRVHLRAAAPSIASASRAAAALGWIAVVAAEYVGSNRGLGYLIINASTALETATVIAGMVAIGVIGAGVSAAISWLARRRLSYG